MQATGLELVKKVLAGGAAITFNDDPVVRATTKPFIGRWSYTCICKQSTLQTKAMPDRLPTVPTQLLARTQAVAAAIIIR
jgi:hypothetical protein